MVFNTSVDTNFIMGIAQKVVMLLEIDRVLTVAEITSLTTEQRAQEMSGGTNHV